MLSIENDVKNEIIINKSRFINYLIKIDSIDEVKTKIDYIKTIDENATHYCYAYIFENIKHFSDDGEPAKTAGFPILNVLDSQKLDHVLAVTVRYFGGIKLGAGGLVRAYTKSVTENLKNVKIANYEIAYDIIFECNLDQKSLIENNVSKQNIKKISYTNKVNYNLFLNESDFLKIKNILVNNNIDILDLKETIIKSEF